MTLTPVSLAQRPGLYTEADKLVSTCWPEFMLHDAVANRHFYEFVQTFPDHQFVLLDESGLVRGMVNSVPLALPDALDSLSDEGWDWEAWTGLSFPGSGRFIVPKALNPVTVDRDKDTGVYIEPNVWILHD